MSEHKPDKSKIAKPLAGLAWQPMDAEREWYDGAVLLVAVPVCHNHHGTIWEKWKYEYSVLHVYCDEHYFNVSLEGGDDWGWELEDCDWYVVISE